jgi:hypothetical protein
MMMTRTALLLMAVGVLSACGGPDILKTEPLAGELPPHTSVLVDDGRCPAGQLSKVTGPASLIASRTYACVAKP